MILVEGDLRAPILIKTGILPVCCQLKQACSLDHASIVGTRRSPATKKVSRGGYYFTSYFSYRLISTAKELAYRMNDRRGPRKKLTHGASGTAGGVLGTRSRGVGKEQTSIGERVNMWSGNAVKTYAAHPVLHVFNRYE